jgi:hypothetical protein
MAQRYDVSLKALFLREGDGIIRRLLFGGKVAEYLSTEQPQISNHRADMVVRTEDGSLHQVEFQASNEAGFPLRMLEYYTYLVRAHKQHVIQVVLYIGPEPLRLEQTYTSPSINFQFEIINLREYDADVLLASDDWADNALALLAKGEPEKALMAVLPRLRAMKNEDRAWAAGTLLLLSGILRSEVDIGERLRQIGMINVAENKILGPIIQERFEEGQRKGRSEGQKDFLQNQMIEKFGYLPEWAAKRLRAASEDELTLWAKRIIHAKTFEETLL